jgi:hypothetical protein
VPLADDHAARILESPWVVLIRELGGDSRNVEGLKRLLSPFQFWFIIEHFLFTQVPL